VQIFSFAEAYATWIEIWEHSVGQTRVIYTYILEMRMT
jgi:hypothetical protein